MNTEMIQNIASLASPLLLAALAGLGWLYKHERERRATAEQQISERKRQVYLSLMSVYFDMMRGIKLSAPLQPDDAARRLFDAGAELLLFGSDEVLIAFRKFRDHANANQMRLLDIGELIVAIRKDMGHRKTAITADDVMHHFVNDYEPEMGRRLLPMTDVLQS